MPKKKLSRNQKRKQKQKKRAQRKAQRKQRRLTASSKPAKLGAKVVELDEEMLAQASASFDLQEERIKQVFNAAEIPEVNDSTLKIWLDYLEQNLQLPCLLEGIESIGYFGWEERFQFGYGSEVEHKRLRRKYGSLQDTFELKVFNGKIEPDWDILVTVRRIGDNKRFTIPLSELEAVDKQSANATLLNDYTVWFVNWH